jgi:protein PhnA
MNVKDSNGSLLKEGDSVSLIKDLKVRGGSGILKRGTVVKNIKLTDSEEEIEGRVEKTTMVLKSCFLKKM